MAAFRLAVVDTNPVQYRAPLWRAIARDGRIDLTVYYASRVGLEAATVPGFGQAWVWDVPLLDGYRHEFLRSTALPGFPKPGGNLFPRSLPAKLRDGRFDAVLVLGYVSAAAIAGMLAAWATRTPVLLRGESHDRGAALSLRKRLKRRLLPLLLKGISGCVAIGEWNRQYWLDLGMPADRLWTAVYSVDNDRFRLRLRDDPNRAAALRSAWGAREHETVFLFSGKLIEAKSPVLLLDAFTRLAAGTGAHLVIVGTGPLEMELKRRAAANGLATVHWQGFVNQQDLPFFYRAADVLVLPSRHEPWGLVVNEALACGTPCIVSDVVGSGTDLIAASGAGTVFGHRDADSLARAMQQALEPDVRLEWRTRTGRALDHASFDANVAAFVDCLATMTTRRSGGMRAVADV